MQCNSLANNDLTNLQQPTKDYVRNYKQYMQNKPKFYNPHIILTTYPERTYKDFIFSELPKNKPNSQRLPPPKNAVINARTTAAPGCMSAEYPLPFY